MVKRYEPTREYDGHWDDDGYLTCRQAKGGKYVLYKTFRNEHARMTAQIERLKKQVATLTNELEEIKVEKSAQLALEKNCFE